MEWLICFPIVNLIYDAFYLKSLKKLIKLVRLKQPECHQHLKKRFIKITVGPL